MIHVYAICDAPVRWRAGLDGVGGAALEASSIEDLWLVVSRHEEMFAVDEKAVLEHAAVVDELASHGIAAVLPARLESHHRDDAALAETVRGRIAALRAALANVRGCVELGVRAAGPAAQADREGDDAHPADYMRARLADRQRLDQLAAVIHEPLANVSRDSVRRNASARRLELKAAYLVPRDGVETFRSTFAAIAREHPELSIVCTGPWPPYSFANPGGDR